ncbi:MAG: D-alanyl-D-alanine carboxypeptidase, partial [Bacteroidota bacterium]
GIILHEHHSPPLSSIVSRTNLQSINLYAETLVREINKRLGKAPHELTSTKIFLDYFEQQLQLDISGVNMNDGSGLGTRNYFPPSFMTAFLKTKDGNNVFLNSIPKAGSTGGLRNRFRGTAAEGKLYAKSGYVSGARCYAGYAFPKNGRRLAFAIMVNNYTIKTRELNQLLFRFMQQLCE